MIEINQSLCTRCGACVKDCPGNALKLSEQTAIYKGACIQCGHCVAICPVNAVSIPDYAMEEVETFEKEQFALSAERYLRAVKFRRSIRNYKQDQVEPEKLSRVLDAGRYSATAKNLQACTFICIQERLGEFKELVWKEMPSILDELRSSAPDYERAFHYFYKKWEKNPMDDTFFFNTTVFLVIASDNPLDAGLAAANIENMAVAEGLGALYSGYMMRVISTSKVLREWLGIVDKKISCCMLMGYPAVTYKRTAPRRKADIIWK